MEIFIQNSILKGLCDLLEKDNLQEEILVNIIWIFANLFGQDEEIRCSITSKIPIHCKLIKIFEKNSLNKDLRSILLFCFKNLTKKLMYRETYLSAHISNLVKKIIEVNIDDKFAINDDFLNQTLEVFEEITVDGNDYLIVAMYKNQFFEKLIKIFDNFEHYDHSIIVRAITIYGNAFLCENREINTVYYILFSGFLI